MNELKKKKTCENKYKRVKQTLKTVAYILTRKFLGQTKQNLKKTSLLVRGEETTGRRD